VAAEGTCLVVGSDGLIGAALKRRLVGEDRPLLGTTRQPGTTGKDMLRLDLSGDIDDWEPPTGITSAFLCAAITTLKQCETDPVGSYLVNVRNIVRLTEKLTQSGVFVVFLSTSAVFDGSMAFAASDTPVHPTTEYGRQKVDAERILLNMGKHVAIVRPTKVIAPNMPLLAQWRNVLERDEPIRPFSDLLMSPLPLDFAVEALVRIADSRRGGIYQLSGAADVSYAEFAAAWMTRLGFPAHLLQNCLAETGIYKPNFSTLDMSTVTHQFGLKPPTLEQTVDSLIKQL